MLIYYTNIIFMVLVLGILLVYLWFLGFKKDKAPTCAHTWRIIARTNNDACEPQSRPYANDPSERMRYLIGSSDILIFCSKCGDNKTVTLYGKSDKIELNITDTPS
jgi:hypothetical protein